MDTAADGEYLEKCSEVAAVTAGRSDIAMARKREQGAPLIQKHDVSELGGLTRGIDSQID